MSTTTPQNPPPLNLTITTPSRRALSADPPTTFLRRSLRTPGSTTTTTRPVLSASGRKGATNAPQATTPHGLAAIRALSSRRAALFTPGKRRRSLRDAHRDTPRDPLRALSRILAPRTEPVVASSSSPGSNSVVKSEGGGGGGGSANAGFMSYDDDDEGPPLRVPRLSLPIDEDDDGDLPRPHRSAGLEDENFTMQSIEFGRRAYSEQPVRSSLGGQRLSDVYGQAFDAGGGMRDDDVGVDSAFFPPLHAIDEDAAAGLEEEVEYEMIEAEDRTALGRESDFGLVVPPPEENESTFVIQPEVGSPTENEPFGMEEEESHVHFADDVVGGDEEEQDGEQLEEEIEAEAEAEELEMETDAAKARSAAVAKARKKKKAGVKVSKYGIQYPSLPPAVVKRLAQTFAKTSGVKGKIAPDTLAAIMQASDWFFEQLGDDLQAYSKHAGRKTIDESDVLQLMRRQRQTNASTTPFSLAQRYLPRELLQELRMPPPVPVRKSRNAKRRADDADEEVT